MEEKIPHIYACLMVRDEESTLPLTLSTLIGINGLIVYDTGSTDRTVEVLRQWSEENRAELHLHTGGFVDFSKSRNELFEFSESLPLPEGSFFLLLDANDEVINFPKLQQECARLSKEECAVYMIQQRWETGTFVNKYSNSKMVRKGHGWRYRGRVHEVLHPPENGDGKRVNVSEETYIYQKRDRDDQKSAKRFEQDKRMLLEDVQQHGDTRDMFYLAQTLSCLGDYDGSLEWYSKRAENPSGFTEERFHCYLRMAEIFHRIKKDIDLAVCNYLKALAIDMRVEPLISLAEIYLERKEIELAYLFANHACNLPFPIQNILFVSEKDYDMERWKLLFVASYNVKRKARGMEALQHISEGDEMIQSLRPKFDEIEENKGPFYPLPVPSEVSDLAQKIINKSIQNIQENKINEAIIGLFGAYQLTNDISPLLTLAAFFRLIGAFRLSYMFLHFTTFFESKEEDKNYDYQRWHLLGIIAYYAGEMEVGKDAAFRALQTLVDVKSDLTNYQFYATQKAPETDWNSFRERREKEMRKENPQMDDRELALAVKLEWKNRK